MKDSKLSYASKFYIENNLNKPTNELAVDCGVAEQDVKDYLLTLNNPKTNKAKNKKVGHFSRPTKGVVSMTGAQSHNDDENRPNTVNDEWMKQYGNCIGTT